MKEHFLRWLGLQYFLDSIAAKMLQRFLASDPVRRPTSHWARLEAAFGPKEEQLRIQ